MGKAEVGSAKYISNQIKAKGLSKLKFYCQVCGKQCRDENGFKCHIVSKSHNDRIAEVGIGSIEEYSTRFQRAFVKLLKLNHGNKFVDANRFYQEFIKDREHVHLNSTKWHSLTQFCIYCHDQNILQVRGGGDEERLEIRYIDNYKESLLINDKKETIDPNEKYLQQQIANNKRLIQETRPDIEPTKLLKERKKPISISFGRNKNITMKNITMKNISDMNSNSDRNSDRKERKRGNVFNM